MKFLGKRKTAAHLAKLTPLTLRELPEKPLPNAEWLRVRPLLTGICGSDIATLTASGSPYFAPLTSMPFALGHEVVGVISEVGAAANGWQLGERIVLKPALGCRARSITPLCESCAKGADALCRNVLRGSVAAGIQTGYCRDTGGAWSENFVAHTSQLYRVPEATSDVAATLVEPFACALHGALRVDIPATAAVFIIGCGAVGLLTIAALRASGCRAKIVVTARYEHQKKHAQILGADIILPSPTETNERYAAWQEAFGVEVCENEIGKPCVIGGADFTFDCVASATSIDDSIRFTKSGGTLVLVGMPGVPRGIDWTPLWYQELTLKAAYTYGQEREILGETDTFAIALKLLADKSWQEKLTALTGEPYPLADYRQALHAATHSGASGVAKTLLRISE